MRIGNELRKLRDSKVEQYDMSCRAMGRLIAQQIKQDFMNFVRDEAPEKLEAYITGNDRPTMAHLFWYPSDDQKYPCDMPFFEKEMERMNMEVQRECKESYGLQCTLNIKQYYKSKQYLIKGSVKL